jgi:hypothetical protein
MLVLLMMQLQDITYLVGESVHSIHYLVDFVWPCLANVLFLLDSLAYYIGYLVYLISIRNALLTGTVPIGTTGVIS